MTDIETMAAAAAAHLASLPPEAQAAHRAAQAESWARGERALNVPASNPGSARRGEYGEQGDGLCTGTPSPALTLADLRRANVARQAEWCPDQVPDLSFRGNELAGEVGEACNVIKKLERERQGWAGSRATFDQLADELADVVICADLAAMSAGIDLQAAVIRKFNASSERVGLRTRLADTSRDDACPVCAVPLKDGDTCATDIEMGTCHAACLEGSPVVDLDTGDPVEGKASTFIYEGDPAPEAPAPASLHKAQESPAPVVRVKTATLEASTTSCALIDGERVARAMEDGKGFWRGCSGCHELNEGHPTGRYNKVLKCHLGLGCYECGGVGAVWDTTDYADMGEWLANGDWSTPEAPAPPPSPDAIAAAREEGKREGIEAAARAVEALPRRVEPLGGQRTSYVQLGEATGAILSLLKEGGR